MKNNKPDWLKKVEQQAKEFNESKFGQMTDGEIARHNANVLGGLSNVKSGRIYKLIEKNGNKNIKNAHKQIECEKCKRLVSTANYKRWHGEKCEHDKKIKVLNSLPSIFTRSELRDALQKMNLPASWVCILQDDFFAVQTYKGTKGSNKDVSKFTKKEGL